VESDYFSLTIKKEHSVLKKELVSLPLNIAVGQVANLQGYEHTAVGIKQVSETENVGLTNIPNNSNIDTPLSIIKQFGYRCIHIFVTDQTQECQNSHSSGKRNAFSLMLEASREASKSIHLPALKTAKYSDDKLFNEVINVLKKNDIGFLPEQLHEFAPAVIKPIHSALWYMDPHHKKLEERGFHLEGMFRDLHGYYDKNITKKHYPR
jgi:hypothetical protein